MNFTFQKNQIALHNTTSQKMLAEVTFPDIDENTVEVNHTFVDESLQGQGIAGQLMLALAEHLRCENKKAVLTCSYAQHWFSKHPEYNSLIKEE
ncbi:GNAT family N-acetyltransferase [Robinsoniella sp. KNHs210]|uniref:GNAT family N-acetyltransferase n=1 Tax=Robinsoniella sp. KNHs210 TaxID=1469950 RepID=UPI000484632E|nr:GNAT family N-acetyltransferase [Robinsoniella sp. KNHs210]